MQRGPVSKASHPANNMRFAGRKEYKLKDSVKKGQGAESGCKDDEGAGRRSFTYLFT